MTEQEQTPTYNYVVSDINFIAKHFPKYEIVRLLDEGAIGASYKTIQSRIERKACLKVIARRLGRHAEFEEMFTEHAKATAQLNHPNLVQLYDFGYVEEICYMVSVKPTSIMINVDIEPKISDFTLAMSLRMRGNADYAPCDANFTAPEVLANETYGDILTDIYSMGAIMYYLLTSIPYEEDYPLASELSTCDKRYDAVIAKAVNVDREQRYQNMEELLLALDMLGEEEPHQRMPAAAAYVASVRSSQTVRAVKRRPLADSARINENGEGCSLCMRHYSSRRENSTDSPLGAVWMSLLEKI